MFISLVVFVIAQVDLRYMDIMRLSTILDVSVRWDPHYVRLPKTYNILRLYRSLQFVLSEGRFLRNSEIRPTPINTEE